MSLSDGVRRPDEPERPAVTTIDSPRPLAEPVWRDVDGSLFAASAVLHHEEVAARVHVVGDLCPSTAPILRSMLDGLIADGIRTIVVDMADLRICTSQGLAVLDRARQELLANGGCMEIEHARGVVREVLDIAATGDEESR